MHKKIDANGYAVHNRINWLIFLDKNLAGIKPPSAEHHLYTCLCVADGALGISYSRLVFIERRSGAVSFPKAPRIVPFYGEFRHARSLLRRESTPTNINVLLRARISPSRGENLPLSTKRKQHVTMGVDVEVLSPGDGNYARFIFLGIHRISFLTPFGRTSFPFCFLSFPLSFSLFLSLTLASARARACAPHRVVDSAKNLAFC